ncbi:MAG: lysylphosphatidylglycerol synthase transmembrane domain-containing protein [Rhodospirillaceae bacterium]
MPVFSSRTSIFALKAIVSTVLLTVVLQRLEISSILEALSRLDLNTLLAAAVLYVLAHGLNGVKLQMVMTGRPLQDLIRYTFVAQYYGTVLPGQLLGDAIKAYRLVRPGDDGAAVVAAVVVDKLTGLGALLFVTGLALLIDPRGFPVAFPALAFVFFAGLILALVLPIFLSNSTSALDNVLGRFLRAWHLTTGDWWPLLASFITGIAFQVLAIVVVAYVGAGMGISLTFAAWAGVVGLVSLVLLLPITVAGIGLREGSLVIMLGFVGVAPTDAVALSLALLGLTLFGAILGAVADLKYFTDSDAN